MELICYLKDRCTVEISGVDSFTFLQNLITNDMNLLNNTKNGLYTLLLNVQGRFLFDFFICNGTKEDSFIIECDNKIVKDLIIELKKYKLRQKVAIAELDYKVFWYLSSNSEYTAYKTLIEESDYSYEDPRVKSINMGKRVLLSDNYSQQFMDMTITQEIYELILLKYQQIISLKKETSQNSVFGI